MDTRLYENQWGRNEDWWEADRCFTLAAQSFAALWSSWKCKKLWSVSLPPTHRAMWTAMGWGTSFMLKLDLSPCLPHNLSSLLLPSVSLLTTSFVCLACSRCRTLFHATLPHTTFIKPLPAFFQSSPRWWEISLAQGRAPTIITTCHTLFVGQLLAVLSCSVKLSCFLLICSVLSAVVIYHEYMFMMPIPDLLHDFGWIWQSKVCRCWAVGQ